MALSVVDTPALDSETNPEFAPLSDQLIAKQTDSGSFSRGRTYFRGKRIFKAVRRGNRLRARCYGSSGGPYVVEATLAPADKPKSRNPVTYSCDCPRGGFCKHVVALLLTWVDSPETFQVRQPVGELLAGRSKEELIALVESLLAAAPDLEEVIEQPLIVSIGASGAYVDESAIRRQIKDALRDNDYFDGYGRGHYDRYGDYYAASRIASKLGRLIELAEESVAAADWSNALAVAATFVEEVSPNLETISDHDGDLYGLLGRTDDVLAACLDAQPNLAPDQQFPAEARGRLIDAILALWQVDLDIGGIDISGDGPEAIGRSATVEEQKRVAIWLRRSLRPASTPGASRTWQNQATIGFLSLLSGEAGLSDEELLTEYRDAEMWDEAAEMLVRLGRHDEAVSLAARRLALPQSLMAFADLLITTGDAGRVTQAIALVDDRLWEQEGQNAQHDRLLGEWLERRYAEHGQPEKALALARDRFAIAPNRTTFAAVKAAALLPDQPHDPWPALRPELIATLRKRGEWYGLIDIHLEEGEVGDALAALKQSEKKTSRPAQSGWVYSWPVSSEQYEIRIAAAAEANFPDEAIRLYQKLADQKITGRNRPSYQQAAGFLARVKTVLEANDRAAEWPALIADLRAKYKTLRALREELDLLGLN